MRILLLVFAVSISGFMTAQLSTYPSGLIEQKRNDKGITQKSGGSTGVVRVFVLAGQSNMQGHGKIYDGATGAVGVVMASFTPNCDGAEMCDFTFNMVDGFGDGWNGWTYDFVQNGVVMATETLPNGSVGTTTITLQSGIACDVVVNQGGAYGAEISWTLTDSGANVVASMNGQQENYPSPNTLIDVMEDDTEGAWAMLQTGGEWTVLEDAYIRFENGDGIVIKDNVTIGQGVNSIKIGPELMFAHQVDQYFEDPVLIIKTAWGGISLAQEFRPPSAGGITGPFYLEMLETVANVTQNLATEFPEIGISDFEISGFGWFQGWNDAGSPVFLNEYESNMYHLVNDVRTAFGNPELPFVIASAGQGGYEPKGDGWMQDVQNIVAVAQENVGCNDLLYGGTVGFVDSKAFYLPASQSPDDAGYHYNNNALTMLNVGKSMGDQMVLAINNMAFCDGFISVPSESSTSDVISVYPNPAMNTLTIKQLEPEVANSVIRLYDMSGRVVFENRLNVSAVVDVSKYSRGLYVLECISNGLPVRHRVVLE